MAKRIPASIRAAIETRKATVAAEVAKLVGLQVSESLLSNIENDPESFLALKSNEVISLVEEDNSEYTEGSELPEKIVIEKHIETTYSITSGMLADAVTAKDDQNVVQIMNIKQEFDGIIEMLTAHLANYWEDETEITNDTINIL